MILSDLVHIILNKSIRFVVLIVLCTTTALSLSAQVEICTNGIDDDGDGLIDLNDDDCPCEVTTPISLIPNPSFEEMDCCPQERSQLNCASSWIQASEPTTDHIHNCGWPGWDDFPPPEPFPDGDGIMGFRDGRVRGSGTAEPYWKEYAGACLLSPMMADSNYRIQFDVGFVNPERSPPIDITFFGTTNCNYLPFGIGDEAFGCPSNDPNWKQLAQVRVSGGAGNTWVNSFLEISPTEDIYAIAIGPDCNPVPSEVSIYYFFDNLILADFKSFDLKVKEIEHPCSNDFRLSVPFNEEFEYQWYLNGIALDGEIYSELSRNYGEGDYIVRIFDGVSCRISAAFDYQIPVISSPAQIRICDGEFYEYGDLLLSEPGIYLDTFLSQDNCDSIVSLELEVVGLLSDSIQVSILLGESYEINNQVFREEGEYPLLYTSSLGCDSTVLLQLSHFNVFIPNIFTPNSDGRNDIFYPIAPMDEVSSVNVVIFDRWGNKVHQGTEWRGIDVQPGVYVYLISFEFINGSSKMYSGDVTLLR